MSNVKNKNNNENSQVVYQDLKFISYYLEPPTHLAQQMEKL